MMAFQLQREETVPEGVRRITRERIDEALKTLDRKKHRSASDKAVHTARKRFKQVRGALRMVRKELGRKDFMRENRTFRDAGRPLSEVRDAKVMIETAQTLAKGNASRVAKDSFGRLHAALEARRQEIRIRVLGGKRTRRIIRHEVRQASRRISRWPLVHKGWRGITPGLRRIYAQGREAFELATRDASDERLHELRKRGKDLRYGVQLLAALRPASMQPIVDAARRFTDLLGKDHDLAVLHALIGGELKSALSSRDRLLVRSLIVKRRRALQEGASDLGRELYAESDDEFVDRIHGYWKAWRRRPE
jgi:CHAD domain-containing protein